MKKLLFITLAIGISYFTYAQTDLISTFNSTHSGRSVSLGVSKTFGGKNELGLGLRYNINKYAHSDDQNNIFKKRLYANDFFQFWGLECFYNRYFIHHWECAKPFFFYDLQLTHSQTRNRMHVGVDDELGPSCTTKTEFFGPFTWVEQCVGVGLKVKLHKRFYLYQKIGCGALLILGKDNKLPTTYNKFTWELAGLIQAGLVFRLKE